MLLSLSVKPANTGVASPTRATSVLKVGALDAEARPSKSNQHTAAGLPNRPASTPDVDAVPVLKLGALDAEARPHGTNRHTSRGSAGEPLDLNVGKATRANWRGVLSIKP